MLKLFFISMMVTMSVSVSIFADTFPTMLNHVLSTSAADETIVWQRAPIEITLPVGKERFVSFPTTVQFGYNTALLPPSVLQVENDNQTLYLLAKKPFAMQRVEAKLASGEIILLDIHAMANADDNAIDIALPTVVNHATHTIPASNANVSYIAMVRFAVQQLYAPPRLLKNWFDMTRFPMETNHVVPLFYDGSAVAMPLASWQDSNLYVTAILIKNLVNQPLQLDPRLLCGDWEAASFYPQSEIAARGAPLGRDTSSLFVVSSKPFTQAIQSCLTE